MTTRQTAAQPALSPAVRRRVASMLGEHIHLHLSSTPKRGVSLAERGTNKGKLRPAHTFVITATLKVYTATLSQLSRRGVRELMSSGFGLLIESPLGQHLLVEISAPKHPRPAIRVISGPTVDSLCKALIKIAALPQARRSDLRLLRVAALHLSAVWRSIPGQEDLSSFVPYGANLATLKSARVYAFPRFEKIVQSIAIQFILRWYERCEQEQLSKMPLSTKYVQLNARKVVQES